MILQQSCWHDREMLLIAGSPHEMGYAQGELLKEKVNDMMNDVWKYLEEQVVSL